MLLAREDFQELEPGDIHDHGNDGETEIYSMHGNKVENALQE